MRKLGALATVTLVIYPAKLASVVNIEYFVHLHSEIVLQRVNKVNHMHSNQEVILRGNGRSIGTSKET